MKRIKTLMIVGLTLFLAVSFSATSVLAASGNKPQGDPPYGLKVQGDAKGTKLIGVLYVELSVPTGALGCYSVLEATVRLSKGSDVATFALATPLGGEFCLADEEWTQDELFGALSADVNSYFFPGEDRDIVLKDVSTWGQVQGVGKYDFLIDVVLAAQ